MSPEKKILENVSIEKVGENYFSIRERLANHYFRAWVEHGLCDSPNAAVGRLDTYYDSGVFDTSFIAIKSGSEKVYSLVLTRDVYGSSVLDVLQKIRNYNLLGFLIPGGSEGDVHFSVCFSVTAEVGFRVQNENMPQDVSLSEFLLFGYEAPSGSFKTAYSRFAGVGRGNVLKYYAKNVNSPRKMGATGMHEEAYGGVTLAIIEDSRPEDRASGQANSFVLLPVDATQKEINAQIMENRKTGFIPYEKIGPFILFKDTWPYLSLAR